MKIILHILLFTSLCCLENKLYSQTSYPDAGMWTTFSIEKELSSKFSINLDEEFRLKENFTMLNLFYTNLGFAYKPSKRLKLALTYRLVEKWKYEDELFSFRHRLMFDVSYKYKLKDWTISYRSRIQSEVRDMYTSELGKIPEWYWRNKLDFKYKIRRYTPFIGTEFRYQITDPRNPESNFLWHRVRLYAGSEYEINQHNSFGIYYLLQREFNIPELEYLYIIGLQYTITI